MDIIKTYNAAGFVLGNYWGGGQGSYPAVRLSGFESKESLIEEAEKRLKCGSLDSGMGYESLIGAILDIEEIKTIEHDGEEYQNSTIEEVFIGKLSDVQKEFLQDVCYGARF
jgi:hypothetical protein